MKKQTKSLDIIIHDFKRENRKQGFVFEEALEELEQTGQISESHRKSMDEAMEEIKLNWNALKALAQTDQKE